MLHSSKRCKVALKRAGCWLALVALKRTGCDVWQVECHASNDIASVRGHEPRSVAASLSFFRRLISAVADWMSTVLPHMVWP